MKMGGMGYKESSGLTPWASRARRAESSFGTPSPLHESLQFPVAEASEAANRNVGFTSIAAGGFAQTPAIAQPRAEWVNSTEACQNSAKFSDRPRGAKISIIFSSLDGLRARKSERNRAV